MGKHFNTSFLGLVLVVSGFTGALGADMSPAIAVQAHLACVSNNVAKLDDGKMAPDDLAKMIVPLCHDEHTAAMKATNGDPDAQQVEFSHTMAAVMLARARLKAHPQ
jgi:hypothetical protein